MNQPDENPSRPAHDDSSAVHGTSHDEADSAQDSASKTTTKQSWVDLITSDEFRARNAVGPGMFLDAGLPLALFTVVYAAAGRDLKMALWVALGAGAVLAAVRLVRRDPLQNVIGGFIGLGVAVFWASRTGQAEDVFAPGLLINVTFGVAYLVSVLVRWPLLGVIVGIVLGHGFSWRDDPALLRAYSWASALWAGMFAVRLAVQAPLYFSGDEHLGWLATARLVMGVPLFLLVVYLSYVIIRPAYRAHVAQ